MSISDLILGYSIGILFVVISILFFKNRALFLIAGFDKESLSNKQIRVLAKSMGRYMLNIGVLIFAFTLINHTIVSQNIIRLVFAVIATEFIISTILVTYRCFSIKICIYRNIDILSLGAIIIYIIEPIC